MNNIVKTYTETGLVNHVARGKPQYADAPDGDFFELARTRAGLKEKAAQKGVSLEEYLESFLDDEIDKVEEKVAPEEPEQGSEAPNEQGEEGA